MRCYIPEMLRSTVVDQRALPSKWKRSGLRSIPPCIPVLTHYLLHADDGLCAHLWWGFHGIRTCCTHVYNMLNFIYNDSLIIRLFIPLEFCFLVKKTDFSLNKLVDDSKSFVLIFPLSLLLSYRFDENFCLMRVYFSYRWWQTKQIYNT